VGGEKVLGRVQVRACGCAQKVLPIMGGGHRVVDKDVSGIFCTSSEKVVDQ